MGGRDYFLVAVAFLAFLFVLYWTAFGNYRYTHYVDMYYDMGIEAYAAYWHINGLGYYTNPLQYLIFTDHLSLSFVLLLPFYFLFQQPTTLFVIQASALALAAILLYFLSRDLIKSRQIAFAMAVAFLLNPGATGLVGYDFHPEALMPLFYLLTFYFYTKRSTGYFTIAFILLLGVLEVTIFVGASLIAGLFLYEFFYNKNKDKEALRLLLIGACLLVLFFIMYYLLELYLPSTYTDTSVVPTQRLFGYMQRQVNLTPVPHSQSVSPTVTELGLFGLVNVFTGFGLTSLASPFLSLVFYSPWLLEVLVVHFQTFVDPDFYYFSYAVGGSAVAALIGLRLIMSGRLKFIKKELYTSGYFESLVTGLILAMSLFTPLAIFISWPLSYWTLSYAPNLNYTALNNGLGLIPQNASVLAQDTIATHLTYIRNLEMPISESAQIPGTYGFRSYWFTPNYIILNRHLADYPTAVNSIPMNQTGFGSNYTLLFNQSGTLVYKLIG